MGGGEGEEAFEGRGGKRDDSEGKRLSKRRRQGFEGDERREGGREKR